MSPTPVTNNVRMSGDLSGLTVDYWQTPRYSEHPTHTSAMRVFLDPFDLTVQLPVSQHSVVKQGSYAISYKQDFYYRVHVRPQSIDFGNLLNDEVETVTIWNAFFEPVLMGSPSLPTQPGLDVALPAGLTTPYVLKPTEEVLFTVTASVSGPPSIDATFTVEIDGVEYEVEMTGRRILLWPFPPNWASGLDDTYAFKSWALRAADGHVQSGSQWGNAPRREISYNVLLRRDDAARAENMMFGWQSRMFGVVCWPEKSRLTADAAIGDVVIACDTDKLSFAAGGFLAIYQNSTVFENAEIESVAPGAVTLTSALKSNWPSGTKVYPVFAGLINASLSGVRHTDGVIELPVSFECDPKTTYGNTPVGAGWPEYQGEELYLGPLNWASALAFEYESDREKLDFNTGTFASFSGSDFSPQQKTHTWVIEGRDQAAEFLAYLGRREGIARPVYMPTGNSDLALIADVVAASSFIDVIDTEYASLLAEHPARRDILVVLRNGTSYARRITGATAVDGGTRISLATPWASAIERSQVKRISFLGLYRLTSNKSTIHWITDKVGTVTLQLVVDRTD